MNSKPSKMTMTKEKGILSFLEHVGHLKHLKRAGWVHKNITECETVSGHMYRMAMMTFLLDSEQSLNRSRCMELALVHDLAECIVGDITPRDGVPEDEKHDMEMKAMQTITQLVPPNIGERLMALFKEYEDRITPESKFVKEIDVFDLAQQAFYYEKQRGETLDEFFSAVDGKISTPWLVALKTELYQQRSAFIATLSEQSSS